MSERNQTLPDGLRSAIEADLRPVNPLFAPWKRVLLLVPVALIAMGMPLVYFRLRDMDAFGMVYGWVPVAIQILLAFGMLFLALREGIPGFRSSATAIFGLCTGAYALQVLVNLAIYMRDPMPGGTSLSAWLGCFRMESLIGIPILLGIAWLVGRSLPQRPALAGFLAGTGAGFAGEASWRLICPVNDPGHVLLGHTGGVLVLGLTGLLLGLLWAAFQRRPLDA